MLKLIRSVTRWLQRRPPEGVLILGTSSLAYKLATEIQRAGVRHGLFLGLLDDGDRGNGNGPRAVGTYPIVGHVDELDEVLAYLRPDRIIVALSERRGRLPVNELLKSRLQGIVVENGPRAYERFHGKLAIESLRPSNLVFEEGLKSSRSRALLKRFTSLLVAAVGFIAALPLMAAIVVAIRLDSRGPIFFGQDRIGARGRRFTLLKFRSMCTEGRNSSEWAADNLDRVTRVGYWLRKSHLDELPQFLNILRGDMDLVGPRPHPVSNHTLFEREIPYYCLRSIVRPGLTGWAQVRLGYANGLAEETEKMRYDLYYIKNQSPLLDLRILFETMMIVAFGRGYPEAQPRVTTSAESPLPLPERVQVGTRVADRPSGPLYAS